ncbi:unnamed protein product [Rotaria sp. Silwood1]|nr:unnamed protein product [Rotaria sp. Silwood1]CAF5065113.1 unnamed protein product [Rotaria sp. Silwood1]
MIAKCSRCLSLQRLARPPLPEPGDGICTSATWDQNGVTVAGGNKDGSALNQLDYPKGLFLDGDAMYIADNHNCRVVKWMLGAAVGQVVASVKKPDNDNYLFDFVTSVVVDKNGIIFICDEANERVERWVKNVDHGEIIIANISCWGLALDNEGSLYVSAFDRVLKWPGNEVVAGGNGQGSALNQLYAPRHLFVDQEKSIFVADYINTRVVKWSIGAKEGIVVAGGKEQPDGANQLSFAHSVVVDQMGTVYTVDYGNHRVMRWFNGSKSGNYIIGGREAGNGTTELSMPSDLKFDRHGNLYVLDTWNQRVQMFAIDKSSCIAVQVNHKIQTNSTAFRCARCNGNIDIARYLTKNGVDVHFPKIHNETNLVLSVYNEDLTMTTYLVDESIDNGCSFELVQFLLNYGT